MKRRTFVVAMGAGAAGLFSLAVERSSRRGARVGAMAFARTPKTLSPAEWRTLAAAQDRLLPSEPGAPGARDVNAIGYLDLALAEPDTLPEERERVRWGAERLDAIARGKGAASFAVLDEPRRDEALHSLQAEDDGEGWFEAMLGFTLEALLGDPVHGGNRDEIAWKWLGHQPGWPRPPQGA